MGRDNAVLSQFFARYPSALGGTRGGGFYRVICLDCGALVSVAVPDGAPTRIDILCTACGWEDHLSIVATADTAAGDEVRGALPAPGTIGDMSAA